MTEGITATKRAFLLGLREDGSPTCHPMTAVMTGGEPMFNTYRKSIKVTNFLRDPRAACLLLENWQASPATADIRTGVIVEAPPPGASGIGPDAVAGELLAVPESVKQRSQRRVDSGKRIYFRLASAR